MTSYTTLLPSGTQGGKPTDVLVVNGGNPDLQPEKSKAYTAGIDWAPVRWPQISGSLDYFNISYRDRIQSQSIEAEPLDAQPQLISLTGLNPGLSQVLPYFQMPGFQRDGAGLGPGGVTAIVDNQVANEATTLEQGIRASGQYRYDAGAPGKLIVSVSGNHLFVDRTSFEAYFPESVNVASTIAEPPKFRLRGDIAWQWRSFTADIGVNHSGAYANTLFSPPQRIDAWTTEDMAFKFEPGDAHSPLRGLTVVLNVQNLTDRRPPYLSIPAGDVAIGRSAVPFDGTNASAVGRYLSVEFRKAWR
jgi:iron complex outermembrane recepter protein